MSNSIVGQKSYKFAKEIVFVYKELTSQNEFVMSRQLLKSATSVGANIEEALQGHSKKEFISKLGISLKEAVETRYWLRLLLDTNYLDRSDLIDSINEIIAILISIIKTSRKNMGKSGL